MNCSEAEVYVSALYDGEVVPSNEARHIAECEICRHTLKDYSEMGAELRLAAAVQPEQLLPLSLPPRRKTFSFCSAPVGVPRFALAGLAACLVITMITTSILLSQTRPLWFDFEYGMQKAPQQFLYKVAQSGYDDTGTAGGFENGAMTGAVVRVRVRSVSADDVVLQIRSPAEIRSHSDWLQSGRRTESQNLARRRSNSALQAGRVT